MSTRKTLRNFLPHYYLESLYSLWLGLCFGSTELSVTICNFGLDFCVKTLDLFGGFFMSEVSPGSDQGKVVWQEPEFLDERSALYYLIGNCHTIFYCSGWSHLYSQNFNKKDLNNIWKYK
jgi:hypothetical protein